MKIKTPSESSFGRDVVIRVSDLRKQFGDFAAVDGLTFDVYRGEILGFLGPNGAGKTTTINMICGLTEPTQGEIVVLGETSRRAAEVKTVIGLCSQENIFWPRLTCLEQLVFMGEMYGMSGKAAEERAKQLLQWMALDEKSDVLAGKLSGGMKRRLNICLALIHDPEILILDEPEAGLDPQSRVLVRDFVRTLTKDKTVVLTTHNMDEADRLADRVAIIDYGRLLLLDTPGNLKKSIGEGDVIEIDVNADGEQLSSLVDSLLKVCDQVSVGGSTLIIKSKNLIERVSEITDKVKGHGLEISSMTMRENTLEDVFIHLTGRKLRQ